MPRTYYRLLKNAEINVWRAEKDEQFYESFLKENNYPIKPGLEIRNNDKRRQWMASRYALTQVYPEAIQYYSNQKPTLLNGPKLSISHSEDDIALMISNYDPGIDIQWPNDKLLKIANKYLSDGDLDQFESLNEIEAHTIAWSIKEAVFKFYGSELTFKKVIIQEYDPVHNTVLVEVERRSKRELKTLCADFIGEMAIAYILE